MSDGTAVGEDLLAERGVVVSRESIRLWVNRCGAHFAACIRRDRPTASDKWHLDEVVLPINGVKCYKPPFLKRSFLGKLCKYGE